MGHRYQNKVEEEAERQYLASLSPAGRVFYKIAFWLFMLIGCLFAFWGAIGWWLVKLFGFWL